MAVIVPIDMPGACNDCPFLSQPEEIPVGDWMYTKICRCTVAPKEIEETYHKLHWLVNNKPEWCPLKEAKRKQTIVNCENCYHYHMCDLQYRLEEHQDCKHYKDKSLIVEKETDDERKTECITRHYD